jgi:flagellar hook protein FlgE
MVDGKLTLTDTVVGDSQLAIDSISYASADGATPLTAPTVAQLFGNQGGGFTINPEERYTSGPLATTCYAGPSTTLYQNQNGFSRGILQDIHVDTLGNITGEYSNGREIKQAQLVLADFVDLQGLETEGNNIFVATAESGPATVSTAGHGSFGTISGSALEMSNVDIAKEMADLIITQRAFQANSKSITTSDQIYDSVLQLIRR